jgi:glutamate racemase
MNNKPIGVFDSGLGGLTVVKEIKKLLPYENIIYLGDTARVPYGTRSKDVVIKFSFQDADYLISKKVKCLVVACNTASSFAGDLLKKHLTLPVFDVIKPVAEDIKKNRRERKIGIIGTKGTISSHAYKKAILKKVSKVSILEQACPLFVPMIEEGEIKGSLIEKVIEKYLSVFKTKKIDTLVLGCTHYPIIEKEIQNYLGKKVILINPEKLVAEDLKKYLQKNRMLTKSKRKGKIAYLVTDISQSFLKVAEIFLGTKITSKVTKVQID